MLDSLLSESWGEAWATACEICKGWSLGCRGESCSCFKVIAHTWLWAHTLRLSPSSVPLPPTCPGVALVTRLVPGLDDRAVGVPTAYTRRKGVPHPEHRTDVLEQWKWHPGWGYSLLFSSRPVALRFCPLDFEVAPWGRLNFGQRSHWGSARLLGLGVQGCALCPGLTDQPSPDSHRADLIRCPRPAKPPKNSSWGEDLVVLRSLSKTIPRDLRKR